MSEPSRAEHVRPWSQSAEAPALRDRSGVFTGEWAAALAGTSHVPMSSAEVTELLGTLARRLIATAGETPFLPQRAAEIGAALVEAHFVGADALGRSLTVIGRNLAREAGPMVDGKAKPELAVRLGSIQEHMAAGYVRALRDRTLAEQESIRRAEIEARRYAEDALRTSEQRFRAVFTDAAIGIGLADIDGRIVESNPAFARMLGYTLEEFTQLNVGDFVLAEDAAGMWESYGALVRGDLDCVRTKKRYRRKDGGLVWTNLTASLIRDGHARPQYTLALVEDVSERHDLEEKLRHQALHDPLTGVANRTLFLDRLATAVAEPGGRIGICYLDLDGFKSVNDTLGHDVGDELLIAAARRLERRAAESAGLVARMGGDEFVLLVENSGGLDAMVALAGDVLAGIEQPFRIGRHRICISTSIGIVERPVDGTDASDVVKDADSALYWAKNEGPGRFAIYDPARQADDHARITLTASMRSALESNEFALAYQPIVDLPSGALRGVEALLRWNHPTMGVLSPEAFIALAESSGMITPLGRWVMETACRQASEWQRLRPGAAPYISVNVSAQQAEDMGLVTDVARIIADTELAPELLQLELTESVLVEADSRPLETLQKLSAMGVRIAADDFGSGYSNLAYLRRLPVDALKLSASFIRELWPDGPADEPVISALAGLAHKLGLSVTVEGVETSEQAGRLAALGCDTAQGWYFASAVPADHITALLRETPEPRFP
jgi:diguanylate cyclase (GGDEF)-like protein/PAS domain S-box-containing protein